MGFIWEKTYDNLSALYRTRANLTTNCHARKRPAQGVKGILDLSLDRLVLCRMATFCTFSLSRIETVRRQLVEGRAQRGLVPGKVSSVGNATT